MNSVGERLGAPSLKRKPSKQFIFNCSWQKVSYTYRLIRHRHEKVSELLTITHPAYLFVVNKRFALIPTPDRQLAKAAAMLRLNAYMRRVAQRSEPRATHRGRKSNLQDGCWHEENDKCCDCFWVFRSPSKILQPIYFELIKMMHLNFE